MLTVENKCPLSKVTVYCSFVVIELRLIYTDPTNANKHQQTFFGSV